MLVLGEKKNHICMAPPDWSRSTYVLQNGKKENSGFVGKGSLKNPSGEAKNHIREKIKIKKINGEIWWSLKWFSNQILKF